MSVPDDLRRMWQEMAEQLQSSPPGSTTNDLVGSLFAPMQRQAEVMEQAVNAQVRFHQELTERMLAPMMAMLDGFEQLTDTMRATGSALKQAGTLMEEQASRVQQMVDSARIFKAAGERPPSTTLRRG
jgi:hypothetical protein